MNGNLKLIVLDLGEYPSETQPGGDVGRALDTVAQSGAQVRQSSGRLLVVDAPELNQTELQQSVPGAQLLSLHAPVADLVPPLDESETLFLEGLRISTSAAYRRDKARQTPGESPEEQLMFTAPCLPDGESNG
ncbi:MAG: hypothetical protein R6W83_07015 [Cryobacterium sp.]